VIDYLTRAGVAWREDETNRDPRFLRNRVRHELLPLLEALAPRPDAGAIAAPDAQAPPTEVLIYGADWCGACKQAARYLKQKGIKFLEKDVDRSPTIQAELQAKLRRAGMPATSSIPVIDIEGHLLVGFNAAAIDAALAVAKRPGPTR